MEFDAQDPGPPPPPAASQASSHFPLLLEPVSGATLFELETARRGGLRGRGALRTGSAEIDDAVLLGGFERGQVVGVSAEEVEFGVLVGLHTVAHATVSGAARKATIITTLAPAAILPMLRDVIRVQVQAKIGPAAVHRQQEVNGEVRRCLELISVSRVFDVEGLWEVISEIETPPSPTSGPSVTASGEERGVLGDAVPTMDTVPTLKMSGSPRLSSQRPVEQVGGGVVPRVPVLPSLRSPPMIERTEVGDSEDDEDEELSSSPSSPPAQQPSTTSSPRPPSSHPHIPLVPSPSPPAAPTTISSPTKASTSTGNKQEEASHIPDVILVTHFSSLLTNLFARSADNKAGAHSTLQLLSSHLRYLARSAAGPLVMLLNTTTSSSSFSTSTTTFYPSTIWNAPNTTAATKARPLEPTLRSVFNPGPGRGGEESAGGGLGADARRQRANAKPAFGVIFAQFLDLHLLCTRVPRARADAEALYAVGYNNNTNSSNSNSNTNNNNASSGEVRYTWVVEALLDELGVWEWDDDNDNDDDDGDDGDNEKRNKKGKYIDKGSGTTRTKGIRMKMRRRRNREQRWGAVDVRSGVRLVDASFQPPPEMRSRGPVRLAAGFGGPPPRGL